MSEEIQNYEAETPDVQAQQIDAPEHEQHEQHESVEDRARRMGWAPKDQFKGDPSKWVDADRFVERGETEIPLLRAQVRNLEKGIRDFAQYHSQVEHRTYERAKRELEAKANEAKQSLDFDAYESARNDLSQLEATKPQPVQPPQAHENPEFSHWADRNQWYGRDRELTAYAESIGAYVRQTNPDIQGQDFLDAVAAKVRKEFPNRFENPRRSAPSAVERAPEGGKRGNGKGYNDLPGDAKSACDRYVKLGVLTREQYLKDYFGG